MVDGHRCINVSLSWLLKYEQVRICGKHSRDNCVNYKLLDKQVDIGRSCSDKHKVEIESDAETAGP